MKQLENLDLSLAHSMIPLVSQAQLLTCVTVIDIYYIDDPYLLRTIIMLHLSPSLFSLSLLSLSLPQPLSLSLSPSLSLPLSLTLSLSLFLRAPAP